MSQIKNNCPHCGIEVREDMSMQDMAIFCPFCGKVIRFLDREPIHFKRGLLGLIVLPVVAGVISCVSKDTYIRAKDAHVRIVAEREAEERRRVEVARVAEEKRRKEEERQRELARRVTCLPCSGKGLISCDRCAGKTTVEAPIRNCPSCSGTGKGWKNIFQCPNCKGSGKDKQERACTVCNGNTPTTNICHKCQGTRTIKREGMGPLGITKFVKCETCNGSGLVMFDCGACNGTGKEYGCCEKCNGSGRLGIRGPCQSCKGSGKELGLIPCPDCEGEGTRICFTCAGRGFTYKDE